MEKEHNYAVKIEWTGNKGSGTDDYRNYERSHTITIEGKPAILGSSDTPFRGDGSKHNPEDFLVSSLSTCHMLWYLHLCADAGVVVVNYVDNAKGTLKQLADGSGFFTEVTLYPEVQVLNENMIELANSLHKKAHNFCFIAKSVNFPVHHQPKAFIG
jgi:organic hydroperoxide reductase OsmC/OhrA